MIDNITFAILALISLGILYQSILYWRFYITDNSIDFTNEENISEIKDKPKPTESTKCDFAKVKKSPDGILIRYAEDGVNKIFLYRSGLKYHRLAVYDPLNNTITDMLVYIFKDIRDNTIEVKCNPDFHKDSAAKLVVKMLLSIPKITPEVVADFNNIITAIPSGRLLVDKPIEKDGYKISNEGALTIQHNGKRLDTALLGRDDNSDVVVVNFATGDSHTKRILDILKDTK